MILVLSPSMSRPNHVKSPQKWIASALLLVLISGIYTAPSARASSPEEPEAQSTLVDHLRRLRMHERADPQDLMLFDNAGSMMDSLMNQLIGNGLCQDIEAESKGRCLRQ